MSFLLIFISIVFLSIVLIVSIKKIFFRPGYCPERLLDIDLTGVIIAVTGASDGIGKALTLLLAKRNATVLLCCRNKQKTLKAITEIKKLLPGDTRCQLEYVPCDLSDLNSVSGMCEVLLDMTNRIDIFVFNAAQGSLTHKSSQVPSKQGFEKCYAVNVLSSVHIFEHLKEIFCRSSTRLIFVSSRMADFCKKSDFDEPLEAKFEGTNLAKIAYQRSKLMSIMIAKRLERKYSSKREESRPYFFSIHPGVVRTKIFNDVSSWMYLIVMIFWYFFKTPEEGAQSILFAALEEDETIFEKSGGFVADCRFVGTTSLADDVDLQEKVWKEAKKNLL